MRGLFSKLQHGLYRYKGAEQWDKALTIGVKGIRRLGGEHWAGIVHPGSICDRKGGGGEGIYLPFLGI